MLRSNFYAEESLPKYHTVVEMEKVYQRLVETHQEADSNAAKRKSKIFLSYPEKEIKFDSPRSWVRYTWEVLCKLYVYWKLLSCVPLDLRCDGFATVFGLTLGNTPTCSASGLSRLRADRKDNPVGLGHIALHRTLPLLTVASPRSPEILFYSTETSKYLWNYRYTPRVPLKPHGRLRVVFCQVMLIFPT